VIPLVTQHFVMLRRALLYTAMTRAKALCVLIGSRRALDIAVRDARLERRVSLLKERLQQP
jgi:exodeoxyribonuclease V alpha subunit